MTSFKFGDGEITYYSELSPEKESALAEQWAILDEIATADVPATPEQVAALEEAMTRVGAS